MLIGLHLPLQQTELNPSAVAAFKSALQMRGRLPVSARVAPATLVYHSSASTKAGDHVLFSGHIQNRQALRHSLGTELISDADLYAAAYAQWGDDADLRVIGSYATIILHQSAAKVRLSASPLSCPPLHYCHDGVDFAVASRAQAIFDTGRIERKLDEHKVADTLFLNYQDPAQGWFENVKRLAGGTRAYVTAKGVTVERYYNLETVPDVRLPKDRDYVEAADALFQEGTRLMLDGFERPAVSLSGGYDSQAVAAYAMQARAEQPLMGYTSVPEEGWDGIISDTRFGDERAHVEALCGMHAQLKPHWIAAEGRSFDYFQREMFAFSLQAQRNAMNLHWIHDIRKQAKADGCDVLLTGAMGNGTFSYTGNEALSGWLARGNIWPVLKELSASGSLLSLPRRFVGQAVLPLLPRRLWLQITKLRHGASADPFQGWCPMNVDYAQDMDVAARAESVGFDPLFRAPASSRKLRAKMLTMAGGEGTGTMLAMEIIHGLPSRDPTSYRPLVEFCLGIPDDQYLRHGVKRWLAKRMLSGKVPEMVLSETRRGRQAADWHLRLSREREALIEEIDWLKEDPLMARRLNLDSLRQALVDFPKNTPHDSQVASRLQLAVSRGVTTARFIRYIEGRNS